MAEYAPPTGPPPPKVPEGWKAVWNEQYSEWFYVNIYTKKSQWEKPTEPIYPPGEVPPAGPPPSYVPHPTEEPRTSTDKKTLASNNPYGGAEGGTSPKPDISEDERLARRLQEEEDARARGAADAYYGQGSTPQPGQYGGYPPQGASPYPQSQSPYVESAPQEKGKSKGGFFGKLLGKHGSSSSQQHGYPQQQVYPQQYGQPQYGQPAGGYYGGQPGYYPQQQMHGRPKKSGMGAGGAAALGIGGGLLGGALLGEALADAGDGGDYGGDGGDFGGDGGDFGGDGGDFGGDF